MSPRRLSFAITVVVAAHSFVGAAAESIYDIVNSNANLTTLAAALNATRGYDGGGTKLVDVLSGEGALTLFAPTNDAFAALPAGELDSWLRPENVGELDQILRYHVWPEKSEDCGGCDFSAADVVTLSGDLVHIHTTDNSTMVNEAYVTGADISASNGVIKVIDAVLFPNIAPVADDPVTAVSVATALKQTIMAICAIGATAILVA
ncbi:hypothetical protein ACHAXA_004010 [Cyclostephanos tholiformis]|uniref:FAS1 domain-containing protein n=1 Tax=Cyclostephanos tholiformis TaxID=382380 RepID=A0ABD3S051_9STRA